MAVSKDINILVVDDQRTMVRIIKSLLNQLGFKNIDEAYDGNAAFDKAVAGNYQLIISDWNMEPVSGFELLKRIRAHEAKPDLAKIPFIMVTAESKTDNVIAAKQAGVNNYIVKPFNGDTLKAKLVSVLGEFD
jgi:two-component system chemotaxis response regulator CheY